MSHVIEGGRNEQNVEIVSLPPIEGIKEDGEVVAVLVELEPEPEILQKTFTLKILSFFYLLTLFVMIICFITALWAFIRYQETIYIILTFISLFLFIVGSCAYLKWMRKK